MSDLNTTFTDESLRNDKHIQWKIDTFLTQLNTYLQKEDRDKQYDDALNKAKESIWDLSRQIWKNIAIADTQQKAADLQRDVVASTPKVIPESKPESLPTTAQAAATVAVVGGTGVVAAIESGSKKAEEAAKTVMKPLEKIKKWSSDIGSAWDAGWELVKKGDISKGIWLFFAVLFGGSLKDALAKYAGKKDETKPADKKEWDQNKNKENYTIYYASVWVFQSINKPVLEKYTGSVRSTWDAILRSEQFMNLNFNMVGSLIQNHFKNGAIETNSHLHRYVDANILKPLGYASNQKNYESVQYALLSIYHKNNQSVIGKHINSEFTRFQKENKDATIRQTVEGLSDEINIADQLIKVDIQDLSQWMGNFLKIDPSGKVEWPLSVALNKWFSAWTLAAFATKFNAVLPGSFNERDFSVDNSFASSQAKPEEVKKLIDFRASLTNSIVNNNKLTFWNNDIRWSIQVEMNKLTYLESLKMYSVLGGESDTNKLGSARMTLLYSTLLGLLDNDSQAQWAYKSALWRELCNSLLGRASAIPQEVQDFLKKATSNLGDYFKEKAKALGLEWLGSLTENPTTTILVTVWVLAFFWYWKFFAVRTSAAGMATKLFGK